MWRLYMTVLLLGFTSGVRMETCPAEEDISPCECEEAKTGDVTVFCAGKTLNLETVKQSLNSLFGKHVAKLTLEFKVGKIPSNFFNGIGIKKLYITDSDLNSFMNDDQPALIGLENYLEDLSIEGSFTEENVPVKLRLGHLRRLKRLYLSQSAITKLGDDWLSNVPPSLERLSLYLNKIQNIGDNAFSQLNKLKELSLRRNQISALKRSMFPSTADKLEVLVLDNNRIADLPADIFSRMPSLTKISLRNNRLRTLKETTFSLIWLQLREIHLDENYIQCDDRLSWIYKEKKRPVVFGTCHGPTQFKGMTLTEFFQSQS